ERFLEWFDPAIELVGPLSSARGRPYRGQVGVERWVRDVDEQFAHWTFSPDEVREVGDKVIATGTLDARGRGSGVALQSSMASVHEFASDHRMTRMRVYLDLQEALKAVGLQE